MQSHVLMVFDTPLRTSLGLGRVVKSNCMQTHCRHTISWTDVFWREAVQQGIGQLTDTKDAMELCEAVDVCFFI